MEKVNEAKGQQVSLTVRRNGETTELSLAPVQTGNEEYKLGIWVRMTPRYRNTDVCGYGGRIWRPGAWNQ